MTRAHLRPLCGALFLATSWFAAVTAQAEQAADPAIEQIRATLARQLPNLAPDSITATPMPGVYEVAFGPQIIYASGDGRYLLDGNLIDMATGVNLTEGRVAEMRLAELAKLNPDDAIVFGPDDAEYKLTVFTDIDCGYCRKLHSEMDGYNQAGIQIRYLFFPRAGRDSESFKKAVSVWCSEDRRAALTKAKQGDTLPPADCANPIAEQLALGERLGVRGTPALVLENGELLPGYLPPARLKATLQERMPKGK